MKPEPIREGTPTINQIELEQHRLIRQLNDAIRSKYQEADVEILNERILDMGLLGIGVVDGHNAMGGNSRPPGSSPP